MKKSSLIGISLLSVTLLLSISFIPSAQSSMVKEEIETKILDNTILIYLITLLILFIHFIWVIPYSIFTFFVPIVFAIATFFGAIEVGIEFLIKNENLKNFLISINTLIGYIFMTPFGLIARFFDNIAEFIYSIIEFLYDLAQRLADELNHSIGDFI